MKSLLIAATVVGASAASLIIYFRNRANSIKAGNQLNAAAANHTLTEDGQIMHRPAHHAMG